MHMFDDFLVYITVNGQEDVKIFYYISTTSAYSWKKYLISSSILFFFAVVFRSVGIYFERKNR